VPHKVTLLTLEPPDSPTPTSWLDAIGKVTPAPPASPSDPVACADCPTTWEEVTSRSYVEVTANDGELALQAKQITDHVNWDRYLNIIQGRAAFAPIKFNGQAFNCNNTGKGWDARDWGAA
jgi:hypothetical protein